VKLIVLRSLIAPIGLVRRRLLSAGAERARHSDAASRAMKRERRPIMA
jgi:hypothetical protein